MAIKGVSLSPVGISSSAQGNTILGLNSLIKEAVVGLIEIGVLELVGISGVRINIAIRISIIRIGGVLRIKLNLRKGLLN